MNSRKNKLNSKISWQFGKDYFCQLILLFSLFFLLFMDFTALFGTIHGSHSTISANFYFLSTVLLAKNFADLKWILNKTGF